MEKTGLKIFNFHPVHLYLNTNRFEDYLNIKPHLADENVLHAARWDGRGCRTLFMELLDAYHNDFAFNMGELAQHYRKADPPPDTYYAYLERVKSQTTS
jgi:hypothetical protein